MLERRNFFLLLLVLLPLSWSGSLLAAQDEATALVQRTAEQMLTTLKARRAEVDRNPSLIYGMVETTVAPHFDFERITQGALGQSWRQASPEQQRQLVNGFKQVLIRTYARSLLSYSGQEIRYLPSKPGSRPGTVTVSTEVRESGAAPIPVDYRMHNSSGSWRVYDVVINNASLVGNYRTSFANEIRQSGLDALIAKLTDMNTKGQE
ncbi:MlaC/ttg2D family ABC transporter substrate-binding protein [Thiobaca trueperi]|uniref:Phospholipid transport system substrate-binding protein n=1 Tax=Thiobaca trueperi TaxID=127458 RepID=A0A4R3N0W4_9GAMM|nr:ABC transporter substrate-binding protein [Thiobaca trueperi]TCT20249.1 phospholipid transport system substrate-binding protein [Thiobaca trueperi]